MCANTLKVWHLWGFVRQDAQSGDICGVGTWEVVCQHARSPELQGLHAWQRTLVEQVFDNPTYLRFNITAPILSF